MLSFKGATAKEKSWLYQIESLTEVNSGPGGVNNFHKHIGPMHASN